MNTPLLSVFLFRQFIKFTFACAILLNVVVDLAYAQRPIPKLMGRRVHDEAGVLSPSTINALEEKLRIFQDSTTNQIAILIVSSLDNEEPEQYTYRVAKDWQLGTEKNDNGVLLFVSVDDRKMRIEVGKGLEGPLPDITCGQIIRNEMAPNFRRNDYDTGVTVAIDAIILATKGEYQGDGSAGEGNPLIPVAFLSLILGIFTFRALFTKGCAGWGLYGFLTPFYAIFPAAFLGTNPALLILITYLIGFPILKLLLGRSAWGQRMAANMGSGKNTRGWTSSGGWFIGGGGGGGGGGGFSGGGGSFGGGGASGSW